MSSGKGPQPSLLALPKPVDVLPAIRSAELGQNGRQDDIEEKMALAPDLPRVRKGGEVKGESSGFGPHGLESPWYVLPDFFMKYKCSYREFCGILVFKQNIAYPFCFQ